MQYREFPRMPGKKVSVLGFGCMRLPVIDGDNSKIDEPQAMAMVRDAIDRGVNYIDTAYSYHGETSEGFVGKVLRDGYREKVYLATKNPVWLVEEYADFEKYLDEQLERLGIEYVDFYLLHALNKERWDKISKLGAVKFMKAMKEKGKIRYAGFSFHDDLSVFKEIIDANDWDFAQIQLNFMDREYQAGLEGLRYAAERDIGIVVMEPLRGGSLTNNIPEDIAEIWGDTTAASWALRWVANFPEVITILSGMSTPWQVEENLETAKKMLPNHLTPEEAATVDKVTEIYQARVKVNCTNCKYCMPCPMNVEIPRIFALYNNGSIYNNMARSAKSYESLVKDGNGAENCIECGACVSQCPQNLDIPKLLIEAAEAMK